MICKTEVDKALSSPYDSSIKKPTIYEKGNEMKNIKDFISGERQHQFVSQFDYVREAGTDGERQAAKSILRELFRGQFTINDSLSVPDPKELKEKNKKERE